MMQFRLRLLVMYGGTCAKVKKHFLLMNFVKCYGDSTSGQRALYNLGLTGIPITNVNNVCTLGGYLEFWG